MERYVLRSIFIFLYILPGQAAIGRDYADPWSGTRMGPVMPPHKTDKSRPRPPGLTRPPAPDGMIKPRMTNLYSNRNVMPKYPNGVQRNPERLTKETKKRNNKIPRRSGHGGKMMPPHNWLPHLNPNRIINMHSRKMNSNPGYMGFPNPNLEVNRMGSPNPIHENRMINMHSRNMSPNSDYSGMMMASAGQEAEGSGCFGCLAILVGAIAGCSETIEVPPLFIACVAGVEELAGCDMGACVCPFICTEYPNACDACHEFAGDPTTAPAATQVP